jgi:hypothetical protein
MQPNDIVQTIIRSDWDIVQLADKAPDCMHGMSSYDAAKLQQDIDWRASGVHESFKKPTGLKQEVVQLVLPPEPLYFSQTGVGPKYLIGQTKPTDGDIYHNLTDKIMYR